jgi:tRNA pseudouridine32 synthase/23S rRNA pseudouridine746 synthase
MQIFQNEHLIAVDKRSGVLTTPARLSTDPRPCLGRELQTELGQQIYPVHRLDFEVSGLVLFAKTTEAHREAQRWFEQELVVKTYQARSAVPASAMDWVEWSSKIVRGKRRSFEAEHGKLARTRARVLVSGGLWELQPLTGRPHQLRVHMARHGYPIEGDTLYGGVALTSKNTICLRAVELDFSGIDKRFGLPERLSVEGL